MGGILRRDSSFLRLFLPQPPWGRVGVGRASRRDSYSLRLFLPPPSWGRVGVGRRTSVVADSSFPVSSSLLPTGVRAEEEETAGRGETVVAARCPPHPGPPPQGGREEEPEESVVAALCPPHPGPPPQGGREEEPEESVVAALCPPHPGPPPRGGREEEPGESLPFVADTGQRWDGTDVFTSATVTNVYEVVETAPPVPPPLSRPSGRRGRRVTGRPAAASRPTVAPVSEPIHPVPPRREPDARSAGIPPRLDPRDCRRPARFSRRALGARSAPPPRPGIGRPSRCPRLDGSLPPGRSHSVWRGFPWRPPPPSSAGLESSGPGAGRSRRSTPGWSPIAWRGLEPRSIRCPNG